MKAYFKNSLLLLILVISTFCHSQNQSANTSNIDFRFNDGKIYITYDIINSATNELYNITTNIFREDGSKLNATSLSGDILEVKGGNGKTIVWDQNKDGYVLDEKIYVTLGISTKVNVPLAKHLLKSAIFPGWGDYKVRNGKLHFLYGVAAFGAIGASIYMNAQANKSYTNYKTSLDFNESNNLFNKAKQQQTLSYVFASTAALVWTFDLATLLFKTQKVKKNITPENSKYYFNKTQQTNTFTSNTNSINTKQPYHIALERGDKLLLEEQYETAKIAYEEAKKYKETETIINKLDAINKIIEEDKIKTASYNASLARAKSLLTQKQFKEAKTEFENANKLKPKEKYPLTKISEIDELLAQIENQLLYETQIAKGFTYLKNEDFETAKSYFETALNYKPDDLIAINKIKECENGLLIKEQKRIDAEYKQKLIQANNLLASKKYEEALEIYQLAKELKPDESEPIIRMAVCENAIEKRNQQINEAEYKRLISLADIAFENKQYAKAKEFYSQADGILPSEDYASKQIQKIVRHEQQEIEDKPQANQATIYKMSKSAVFKVVNSKPGSESTGTGFFISSEGIAITNFHNLHYNLNEQYYIDAKLDDGNSYQLSEILQYSDEYDYIVFRVKKSNNKTFQYLKISKKEPDEFESVFCIGYPLGYEKIPSEGTVSKYIGNEKSLICTNVDITHGSSGGPLLNMKGEVVGITSYGLNPEKFGADAGVNFINFAINISILKKKGHVK